MLHSLLSCSCLCLLGLFIFPGATRSLFWGVPQRRPSKDAVSLMKRELLASIGRARREGGSAAGRDAIFSAVEKLEGLAVNTKSSLTGTWSLVYSTRASKASSSAGSAIDNLSNSVYATLFRFLPRLAGGAEESDGQLATNTQVIDMEAGTIENTVKIRRPFPLTLEVNGEARQSEVPDTIDVIFTACKVNGLPIPLPRPKGSLCTTYCDDSLRISRGGQGGLFVVSRI